MKLLDYDLSQYPIIIGRSNPIAANAINSKENIVELELQLNNIKGEKAIMIFDLTHAKYMSSEIRIQYGNWIKHAESLFKDKLICIILVNKSSIMNMVVKGIMLIKKLPIPMHMVSTLEEGITLANKSLQVSVLV